MNIFVLDESPVLAAQAHADKHVVKLILETAQILSTNVRLKGIDCGYKITHKNHPAVVWARETKNNFIWLKELGLALCDEYTYRYEKQHKSKDIILKTGDYADLFPAGKLTSFALCMPDECKIKGNAVGSYRKYYLIHKKHILKYTKRNPPEWLNENILAH